MSKPHVVELNCAMLPGTLTKGKEHCQGARVVHCQKKKKKEEEEGGGGERGEGGREKEEEEEEDEKEKDQRQRQREEERKKEVTMRRTSEKVKRRQRMKGYMQRVSIFRVHSENLPLRADRGKIQIRVDSHASKIDVVRNTYI